MADHVALLLGVLALLLEHVRARAASDLEARVRDLEVRLVRVESKP